MLKEGTDLSEINLDAAQPVSERHGWVYAHPYSAAAFAGAMILLAGASVVLMRSPVPTASTSRSWGGGGTTILNPTSYNQREYGDALPFDYSAGTTTRAIPVYDTTPEGTDGYSMNSALELDSIFHQLSKSAASKPRSRSSDTAVSPSYAFIPQGLISTTTRTERTPSQQELYDYGNEVGSYVETYEQQNANQAQILTDQMADRANPQKAEQVRVIADALKSVGESMLAMEVVPSAAAGAHAALGKSYLEIGTNLRKVPDTHTDEELLAAIGTYNASADAFAKRFVAFATIFSLAGVKFSPQEAGSVFMFSHSGGFGL